MSRLVEAVRSTRGNLLQPSFAVMLDRSIAGAADG